VAGNSRLAAEGQLHVLWLATASKGQLYVLPAAVTCPPKPLLCLKGLLYVQQHCKAQLHVLRCFRGTCGHEY
jgi:hypothetical protein